MKKFTPGPWRIMLTPSGYTYINAGPHDENKIRIGEVYGEAVNPNCFLVAAAPDLYETCKIMLERLDDEKVKALWESPEEHEMEMEIYRKVIRKAERGER